MNRKNLILTALLGVLAVCLLYAYLASPRLEKAPPRAVSPERTVVNETIKAGKKINSSRIDFSYLDSDAAEYPGAKRDLFRFGLKRAPKKKTIKPVVTEVPQQKAQKTIVPAVTPIEVVQQSLSKFVFLGFLDKGGEKTVFLSSRGELFLVKSGETFGVDQEFHINAIESNLLKVMHEGRSDLIEIPLIEQKKLRAAVSAPVSIARPPVANTRPNKRVFKPQRRAIQPVVAPENEEPFRELIEEYNPVDEQGESPVNEGAAEGEVNGTNQ